MHVEDVIAVIREPLSELGFDTIIQHDFNILNVRMSSRNAGVILKVPEKLPDGYSAVPVDEFVDYFTRLRQEVPEFQ